jgi:hypothetical protein
MLIRLTPKANRHRFGKRSGMPFNIASKMVNGMSRAITLIEQLEHDKRMRRDNVIEDARSCAKIVAHRTQNIAVTTICTDASE